MTDKKIEEKFKISLANRQFEIDLFWKRSLFFWGFIASAFVGFAALEPANPQYSIFIALFGFVCSIIWSLANRGSKYWQEYWEYKVNELEEEITGPNFVERPTSIVVKDNSWLRARRYSVSKLTIALSDFVILLWFGIVLLKSSNIIGINIQTYSMQLLIISLIISLVYVLLVFRLCKSSR